MARWTGALAKCPRGWRFYPMQEFDIATLSITMLWDTFNTSQRYTSHRLSSNYTLGHPADLKSCSGRDARRKKGETKLDKPHKNRLQADATFPHRSDALKSNMLWDSFGGPGCVLRVVVCVSLFQGSSWLLSVFLTGLPLLPKHLSVSTSKSLGLVQ